jgi:ribonuclease D
MPNSEHDDYAGIYDTDALEAACERMARQPFVAVDTEFMRESTFWPRLCLIQVACPGYEAIIDPRSPGLSGDGALEPFFALMANPAIIKVFHAARQDIEIVYKLAKIVPAPLFDTQVAAMVCGFGESVSYAALVKQLTGRNHDKGSRFTDWMRRPLSKAQLDYAIGDVTHLRDVYLRLAAALAENGRGRWLDDEMALLLNPATYETKPENAWRRVKARVRSPQAMAVLMEVAAWRELQAQAQDKPRSRILKDEALVDVANQAPKSVEQLWELRSFKEGAARSVNGREVIDAVQRGMKRDLKTVPAFAHHTPMPPAAAAAAELLRVLLKAVAAQHDVAPRLIASSEDLDAIALGRPEADIPAMHGWRRELFGEAALALKSGKLALGLKDGAVIATPVP